MSNLLIKDCVFDIVARVYTPFHDGDKEDADTGTKVWQSVANALILLGVICVMTVVLLLLYKFRCYKVIFLTVSHCLSISLSQSSIFLCRLSMAG